MERENQSACPAPTARGLNRIQAAAYIGISPSKFDELVDEGVMPKPKSIGTRKIWDVRALDLSFDSLPGQGGDDEVNPWDSLKE